MTRRIYIFAHHYGDAEAYALQMLKASSRSVEKGWRGWVGTKEDGAEWFAQYVSSELLGQLVVQKGTELHIIPGGEKRADLDEVLSFARKHKMPIWWSHEKKWERGKGGKNKRESKKKVDKASAKGKSKAG